MSFSCAVVIRINTAALPNRNTALHYIIMRSVWMKTRKMKAKRMMMKLILPASSLATNQVPFPTLIIKDSCFSFLSPWRLQTKGRWKAARSAHPHTKTACFLKIEVWTMRGYRCNHNTYFTTGSIIAAL